MQEQAFSLMTLSESVAGKQELSFRAELNPLRLFSEQTRNLFQNSQQNNKATFSWTWVEKIEFCIYNFANVTFSIHSCTSIYHQQQNYHHISASVSVVSSVLSECKS